MDYRPEEIHYGAAREIEPRPFSMVLAGATTTVVPVSIIEGFLVGQSVFVENEDGTSLVAKTISAIDTIARTITVDSAFSVAPSSGATLVGPVIAQLGGTDGGITLADKPEMINIEYDQVEGHVHTLPVHHDVDLRFTLAECRMSQWGLLTQYGSEVRAPGTGVPGGDLLRLGAGRNQKFGIRLYIPDPDPTVTLEKIITIYRVGSMDGIETAFSKRDPARNPVTLHALADPSRPRFKRFGYIFDQTAPGT